MAGPYQISSCVLAESLSRGKENIGKTTDSTEEKKKCYSRITAVLKSSLNSYLIP